MQYQSQNPYPKQKNQSYENSENISEEIYQNVKSKLDHKVLSFIQRLHQANPTFTEAKIYKFYNQCNKDEIALQNRLEEIVSKRKDRKVDGNSNFQRYNQNNPRKTDQQNNKYDEKDDPMGVGSYFGKLNKKQDEEFYQRNFQDNYEDEKNFRGKYNKKGYNNFDDSDKSYYQERRYVFEEKDQRTSRNDDNYQVNNKRKILIKQDQINPGQNVGEKDNKVNNGKNQNYDANRKYIGQYSRYQLKEQVKQEQVKQEQVKQDTSPVDVIQTLTTLTPQKNNSQNPVETESSKDENKTQGIFAEELEKKLFQQDEDQTSKQQETDQTQIEIKSETESQTNSEDKQTQQQPASLVWYIIFPNQQTSQQQVIQLTAANVDQLHKDLRKQLEMMNKNDKQQQAYIQQLHQPFQLPMMMFPQQYHPQFQLGPHAYPFHQSMLQMPNYQTYSPPMGNVPQQFYGIQQPNQLPNQQPQ